MSIKPLATLFFWFGCLFWLDPASAQAAEITLNKIAAVVNGEMISLHELRSNVAAELARRGISENSPKVEEVQKTVLDSLVNDILIRQEAKRYKISITEAEVDEEMQRAVTRSGVPPDRFDAELQKQGTTREMFRERLANSMLGRRMANFMIRRKVFVTPEEVTDYYSKNKDKLVSEKTVEFSVMMLPEKLNVQKIYGQIRKGALSFEDGVRQYSVDPSAKEGGQIKDVAWDRLPPDMQKLLISLKDGQISPLLRTQDGFIVIRRDRINEARQLTFEEASPRIEDLLRAPLLEERFKEYMEQLRSKAVIDIRM